MVDVFCTVLERVSIGGAPERGCTRLILGTVRFKGLEDRYQPSAFNRQLTKNKVLY